MYIAYFFVIILYFLSHSHAICINDIYQILKTDCTKKSSKKCRKNDNCIWNPCKSREIQQQKTDCNSINSAINCASNNNCIWNPYNDILQGKKHNILSTKYMPNYKQVKQSKPIHYISQKEYNDISKISVIQYANEMYILTVDAFNIVYKIKLNPNTLTKNIKPKTDILSRRRLLTFTNVANKDKHKNPYRSFGALIFDKQKKTQKAGWASATIIKSISNERNDKMSNYDIIVITAAHNLFDDGKYLFKDHVLYVGAANSGQFVPDTTNSIPLKNPIRTYALEGWRDSEKSTYDLGLIKYRGPSGLYPLSPAFDSIFSPYKHININFLAYKLPRYDMKETELSISCIDLLCWQNREEIVEGMCGGAVIKQNEGNNKIIAVQASVTNNSFIDPKTQKRNRNWASYMVRISLPRLVAIGSVLGLRIEYERNSFGLVTRAYLTQNNGFSLKLKHLNVIKRVTDKFKLPKFLAEQNYYNELEYDTYDGLELKHMINSDNFVNNNYYYVITVMIVFLFSFVCCLLSFVGSAVIGYWVQKTQE
eukprot:288355_1